MANSASSGGYPLVKCLVWDLDDTLWRGTLVEGGATGLRQQARETVYGLDARGVLQSVASRNDYGRAWRRLEELDLADYFLLPQIGWGRKSDAIRTIASGLGAAHDTVAFIDDQPAERAEVGYHLPGVRCYPAERVADLLRLPEFSPVVVTADARRRREMYRAKLFREAARVDFRGPDEEFLRSLELVMGIGYATDAELSRVAELTVRTSQMNATGVHYSDTVLRSLLADDSHDVLVATMADRFGPHGAVGVVLLKRTCSTWHLKLLATSCRVVAFGAGTAILRWLIDQAAAAAVHLVADFRPTDRNRIMEIAYRFAGFGDQGCDCISALPGAGVDGVQRLHLDPVRQIMPSAITLRGPELASVRP
jgi:methoxymalonate biosynthesis protein